MAVERHRGAEPAPAFYAIRGGGWRDWWTILHPPYTVWHLSYVAIGVAAAPVVRLDRLAATLLAFFLAVGIGAHALDELNGRPLRTGIPASMLRAAAIVSLAGAVAIGVAGVGRVGAALIPLIVFGAFIVVAYNLRSSTGSSTTTSGSPSRGAPSPRSPVSGPPPRRSARAACSRPPRASRSAWPSEPSRPPCARSAAGLIVFTASSSGRTARPSRSTARH